MHTPGPWKWWTSCSWRRLKADHGRDTPDILMPCVHRDGQADITVSAEDMALIEAAPDMLAALKETLPVLVVLQKYLDATKSGELAAPDLIRAAIAKAEGRPC